MHRSALAGPTGFAPALPNWPAACRDGPLLAETINDERLHACILYAQGERQLTAIEIDVATGR